MMVDEPRDVTDDVIGDVTAGTMDDVSDDEKYNPTGEEHGTWMPHPKDILEMFDLLSKQPTLELKWKCGGRRVAVGPREEPMDVVEDPTPTPVEMAQETPVVTDAVVANEFDFDDDVSVTSSIHPLRTPGSARTPKAPKRVARMDKVLDDIMRQRQQNQTGIESRISKGSPRSHGSPRGRTPNSPRGRFFGGANSRSPIGSPRTVPSKDRSAEFEKILTAAMFVAPDITTDKVPFVSVSNASSSTAASVSATTSVGVFTSSPSIGTPTTTQEQSGVVTDSTKLVPSNTKTVSSTSPTTMKNIWKPADTMVSNLPKLAATIASSQSPQTSQSRAISVDTSITSRSPAGNIDGSRSKSTSPRIDGGFKLKEPVSDKHIAVSSSFSEISQHVPHTSHTPTLPNVSSSSITTTIPISVSKVINVSKSSEESAAGSPSAPLNLSHTPSPVAKYTTPSPKGDNQPKVLTKSPTPRPAHTSHTQQSPLSLSLSRSPKPAHSVAHSPQPSKHPGFLPTSESPIHPPMMPDGFYPKPSKPDSNIHVPHESSSTHMYDSGSTHKHETLTHKQPDTSPHKQTHKSPSSMSGSKSPGAYKQPTLTHALSTPANLPVNMQKLSGITGVNLPHYKSPESRKKSPTFHPVDTSQFMPPFLPLPAHSTYTSTISNYQLNKPPPTAHPSLKLTVSKNVLQQQSQKTSSVGKQSSKSQESPHPSYRISTGPSVSQPNPLPQKTGSVSPHKLSISSVPSQKSTSPSSQKSTSPNAPRKVSSSPREGKSETPSVETHRVIQTGPLSISIKATSIRDSSRDSSTTQPPTTSQ